MKKAILVALHTQQKVHIGDVTLDLDPAAMPFQITVGPETYHRFGTVGEKPNERPAYASNRRA